MSQLNQKLEKEIKRLISEPSCYKCFDREILCVDNVSVSLEYDYASNLSESISFEGIANFSFKALEEGGVSYTPPPISFKGRAEIENLSVKQVHKPINIRLQQ